MAETCELPEHNPTPEEIREILRNAKVVAVVGLSDDPSRDSHRVAAYLQRQGYRIIPINPNVTEVLGEKAYPRLTDAPLPIDVVDVFRRVAAVPDIVEDAVRVKAGAVWLQDGIVHNAAAQRAREAGMKVVMSRCMMRDHSRLNEVK